MLSDTHGNISALESVLRWAEPCVDAAVFLGDGLRDLFAAESATGFSHEWIKVRGNNDTVSALPEADIFDFAGYRFFLCHGHQYHLYHSYDMLIAAALYNEADVALFGHFHVPIFENDRIMLINPGSIGMPRSKAGSTFAVIECMPEKPLVVQFRGIAPDGTIHETVPNQGTPYRL